MKNDHCIDYGARALDQIDLLAWNMNATESVQETNDVINLHMIQGFMEHVWICLVTELR